MIETYPDYWVVHCEQCSETEEFGKEEYTWQDMIDELKNLNWKIYREKGEWCHDCPACAEEERT